MNLKSARKHRTHEAILESATALLRRQGIRNSTVSDVMKRAGLTVGGFYNHFASKDELFADTIRQSTTAVWRNLYCVAKGPTSQARLLAAIQAYLAPDHRDDPETGCVLPATVAEVALVGGVCREALATELAELAGLLEAVLPARVNVASGSPQPPVLGLVALMYGALSLSRALGETQQSDQVLEAARRMAASLLAGHTGAEPS